MTDNQLTLFGTDQTAARDEALHHVAQRAHPYQTAARQWITNLTPGDTFTATDMRAALHTAGHPDPPEPRVCGAIIQDAHRDHLIYQTGTYTPTGHHARPQPQWTRSQHNPAPNNPAPPRPQPRPAG